MRILIINWHPQDNIGGSETQCHMLASALQRFGEEVCYFAVCGRASAYDTEYCVVKKELAKSDLEKTFSEFKPDVVYFRTNRTKLNLVGKCIRKFGTIGIFGVSNPADVKRWYWRREKLVISSPKLTYYWLKSLLRAVQDRWNYGGFRYFSGLTSLTEHLLEQSPVQESMLLRNSVYVDSVPFAWGRPYIVWVANLKSHKRPEIFVELARRCKDLNVDFLMVGAMTQKAYLWIGELDELDNFHYLGSQTPAAVNGILANCLFLVHTGKPEGFGNVLAQAWFNSKPTLTYEFDPDDIIVKEDLGYCSGNFNKLVENTRLLVGNPGLCREKGARAKSYASRNLDCEENAKRLRNYFYCIINDERSRKSN